MVSCSTQTPTHRAHPVRCKAHGTCNNSTTTPSQLLAEAPGGPVHEHKGISYTTTTITPPLPGSLHMAAQPGPTDHHWLQHMLFSTVPNQTRIIVPKLCHPPQCQPYKTPGQHVLDPSTCNTLAATVLASTHSLS